MCVCARLTKTSGLKVRPQMPHGTNVVGSGISDGMTDGPQQLHVSTWAAKSRTHSHRFGDPPLLNSTSIASCHKPIRARVASQIVYIGLITMVTTFDPTFPAASARRAPLRLQLAGRPGGWSKALPLALCWISRGRPEMPALLEGGGTAGETSTGSSPDDRG